jgi:SNF2 family DNA or RNA helicase
MIRALREPILETKHAAFDYQQSAVEKLLPLEYGAVFHEQGLGKTKIALDLTLSWISSGALDSIIVCTKKHLVENWREEIIEHTFVHPRLFTQDKAANFRAVNSPARIYLTHYEVFPSQRSRFALFLKTRRVGIVLDEAQKIKNPDSNVTRALFALRTGFAKRVIMTGTPIPNRPYDIWSQIYFLDGGESLGRTFELFKSRVDLDASVRTDQRRREQFETALEDIWSSIEPFSTRETKVSSGLQLPAKHVRQIEVELEHRQRELYDRVRNELSAVIVEGGMPRLDEADDVLKRLLRLVQLASNPITVDESYVGIPGKYHALENEVHSALSRGEKVIVWTSFIQSAEWLARELQPLGVARHHGDMNAPDRSSAIKSFKADPGCRVLIATPASAKEGLTLTVANNAIFYDRSFSLDDYLQAQDRIHRISQKRECNVINIVARDTIDEWVDSLVNAKGLAAALAQGDIARDKFAAEMTYGFDEILRKVLG